MIKRKREKTACPKGQRKYQTFIQLHRRFSIIISPLLPRRNQSNNSASFMEHKLSSTFLLWLCPDDKLKKERQANLRLRWVILVNNVKELEHLLMDFQKGRRDWQNYIVAQWVISIRIYKGIFILIIIRT
jgi:hypothetical protein